MRWQALALGVMALMVAGCGQPLLAEADVDGAVAAAPMTESPKEEYAVNDLDAETVLIGHAMGSVDVDGKPRAATNSLEAAEQSYAEGLRVLEVDLVFTSDGKLVARHDWLPYLYGQLAQPLPEEVPAGTPLTHAAFEALPIHGSLTPLDIDGVVRLLEEHDDLVLVTDTKSGDPAEAARQFTAIGEAVERSRHPRSVRRRIIPQIYNRAMGDAVRTVFPAGRTILTLYSSGESDQELADYVAAHDEVIALALPVELVRQRRGLLRWAEHNQLDVYVHTVNDLATYQRLRRKGVDGLYTDDLRSGRDGRPVR